MAESLYVEVTGTPKDVDTQAKKIDGTVTALTNGTKYTVQVSGWRDGGENQEQGAPVLLYKGPNTPTADEMKKARMAAVVLLKWGDWIFYTPDATDNLYAWTPLSAGTSLSITEVGT